MKTATDIRNAIRCPLLNPTGHEVAAMEYLEQCQAAVELAVKFYDVQRATHSEMTARKMAELYLRRKVDGLMSWEEAAVRLADALATRATQRIKLREEP